MLIEFINKILIILFILSNLSILRHFYYLLQAYITSTPEQPNKYRINKYSLLFLGLSVAYVLSTLFTGIKL